MALPIINLSLVPIFPARVVQSGPIVITKAGLTYTFGWDITKYSPNPSPDPTQVQVLGYNGQTGATERYPLAAIQSGLQITASQISDATANGRTVITGTQAAARTALGLGDVATLNVGLGLTPDSGTLRLANSGVAAGAYTLTSVTFDIYGRATAASTVTPSAALDQVGSTRGSVLYRGASGWAILAPGTSGNVLQTNGAGADPNWTALPSSIPGMVLIAAKTASASAQIDFTTELDNTYDDYLLVVSDFAPATDDGELQLLIGTGGGPTYQTSSYTWGADKVVGGGTTPWGSGVASAGSGVVSRIPLSPPAASEGIGNAAGETIRGNIWFANPEVTKYHRFAFKMGFERFDNQDIGWDGNGSYRSSVALTGIRLKFASGNIASGVARLYGFRKTP